MKQDSCRQCGECCRKGGPALHKEDLELIRTEQIPMSALITFRQGELAYNPVTDRVEPLKQELVKLKGTGREWNCCYFDSAAKSCSIYTHRPIACITLKCWDPDELLEMVGKNTLTRLDILAEESPIRPYIIEYDKRFVCPELDKISAGEELSDSRKKELQQLVNADIRFRDRIVKEYGLKLSDELFYFGRPLFQLLQPLGVKVAESAVGLELIWPGRKP